MQPPLIDGYETIVEPPHVYYVRRVWRAYLLEPLRNSFSSIPLDQRYIYGDGRTPHFAYGPAGAPGRVFVRHAVRASAAALLGDLYVTPARFFREMRSCLKAKSRGVAVPDILAARLTHAGTFFYRYTLVLAEVPHAANLLTLSRSLAPAERRLVAREVGRAVRQMHDAAVYHGDLTMKNILVNGTGNDLRVHFIDVDGSRFESQSREDLALANLSRLLRSVVKLFPDGRTITRTDKWRFLLGYTSTREEARRLARRCGRTLWVHRLGWSLLGARR